jgi:putative ubiquitin-RnfH superfamily antitoxin RatB of RatAB toxin-antitoxin module
MAAVETAAELEIEVIYATGAEQALCRLRVPAGTSLAEAVRLSGLSQRYPQIELQALEIGVFGRLRDPAEPVAAGDRVEIYRPLQADPKDARRRRVAAQARRG